MPVQGPLRFDAPFSDELITELKDAQVNPGWFSQHLFHCKKPFEITKEGLRCTECGLFEDHTFDPNW